MLGVWSMDGSAREGGCGCRNSSHSLTIPFNLEYINFDVLSNVTTKTKYYVGKEPCRQNN